MGTNSPKSFFMSDCAIDFRASPSPGDTFKHPSIHLPHQSTTPSPPPLSLSPPCLDKTSPLYTQTPPSQPSPIPTRPPKTPSPTSHPPSHPRAISPQTISNSSQRNTPLTPPQVQLSQNTSPQTRNTTIVFYPKPAPASLPLAPPSPSTGRTTASEKQSGNGSASTRGGIGCRVRTCRG